MTRYRIVRIEQWRRVYEVESDSSQGAQATLNMARPSPASEICLEADTVTCTALPAKEVENGE